MSYKVDYGAMKNLLSAYDAVATEWSNGISAVMEKEAVIETSANIAGNSANCMKEYLHTTYWYAKITLSMLLELFQRNFLLYSEEYYQQIDAARDTHIDEAELSERRTDLQEKRCQMQQIALAAENSVQGISDIVALPSLDISEPDGALGSILASLDELDSIVNGLESTHASADFTEIDELISRLDAYFLELAGLKKEYKTDFAMGSFLTLTSVPALIMATKNAYEQLEKQDTAVANAAKRLEDRLMLEQEEYEKRKKQADWAKVGVGIAVGVVTAALVVTTGPLGAAAVGAIGGAVSSAFSAAADEYTEKGWNTQDWDTNRIAVYGAVGAVTGAVTGAATGFVKGAFTGGFAGAENCVKAGIKAAGSVLEGVGETAFEQLADSGSISDVKAIALEAGKKGASTFVGNLIGGAIAENTKNTGIPFFDKILDNPCDPCHSRAVFAMEGGTAVLSGIVKRGGSEVVNQAIDSAAGKGSMDYQKLLEKMYSPADMTKDMIGDGIKGSMKDYNSWHSYNSEANTSPIVQYKLGHMPNSDTGKTLFDEYKDVDKSLYYLDGGEKIEKPYVASGFSGERPSYLYHFDGGKYGGDKLE